MTGVFLAYLEDHLDGEHACESIIEIIEDLVPETALLDRILCCQGYTAQADNYHNEEIKVRQINHPMGSTANPALRKKNPIKWPLKYGKMNKIKVKMEGGGEKNWNLKIK